MKKAILIIACAVSLSGCGLPLYHADPAVAHTRLKTDAMSSVQICVKGSTLKLPVSSNDEAQVPTGSRIGLASPYFVNSGNMNHSCRPVISFVPQENTSYVGVLLFRDHACYLQILQENPDTVTGLAWEPSVRPGGC